MRRIECNQNLFMLSIGMGKTTQRAKLVIDDALKFKTVLGLVGVTGSLNEVITMVL